MGDIRETLKAIDGATDIFFCGYDGIVVERSHGSDIDMLAAHCATAFKKISIENNGFKEMICVFEKSFLVVRWMEDGFLGVLMGLDGNIGRAKLELNKYGRRFYQ
jgi:predicted regulator of Ras-like GTPase activity (Roadblock/LC7/MglB family)